MEYPLVSIITPCFNDGGYLSECINCVDSLDYPNIEHIIINDGSTDERTCNLLNSLKTHQNRIILNTENEGVCVARSKGVLCSSGKYILPLDADDLVSKEYITIAVEKLEQSSTIKLVTTDYKLFGEIDRVIRIENFSLSKLLGHNMLVNSSIYRRSDFDASGGYSLNMKNGLEDWEFWIKLLKSGGDVHRIEGVHFFIG